MPVVHWPLRWRLGASVMVEGIVCEVSGYGHEYFETRCYPHMRQQRLFELVDDPVDCLECLARSQ